jgi:ribosome-binding factor A
MTGARIPGGAPSQRQLRVGEVIRRRLSEVLARGDVPDPALDGVSITVSEVRMTPDLRLAVAYVLPLGGQNAEAVVGALNRNRGPLRRLVADGVALRHSPDVRFEEDRTFDQMDRTRRLLESEAVRRDVEKDEPGAVG